MNVTIKNPLTICKIGLINFSDTLDILSKIFEERSSLFFVRKIHKAALGYSFEQFQLNLKRLKLLISLTCSK